MREDERNIGLQQSLRRWSVALLYLQTHGRQFNRGENRCSHFFMPCILLLPTMQLPPPRGKSHEVGTVTACSRAVRIIGKFMWIPSQVGTTNSGTRVAELMSRRTIVSCIVKSLCPFLCSFLSLKYRKQPPTCHLIITFRLVTFRQLHSSPSDGSSAVSQGGFSDRRINETHRYLEENHWFLWVWCWKHLGWWWHSL